jgi:hypothetical protein
MFSAAFSPQVFWSAICNIEICQWFHVDEHMSDV